jgi:hypothetical protein
VSHESEQRGARPRDAYLDDLVVLAALVAVLYVNSKS